MRRLPRARAAFVLLLTAQLGLRALPAGALATDGSTLPNARGLVRSGSESAPQGVSADRFTGAATFDVPIAVPPATGGMAPQLALRYSSRSRSDSWVGYGWTLGLSAISRSLEQGVPSYDDAQDTFQLDGQELVPEDPDDPSLPREYRTRRESFRRVIHEADGSWTVLRPDGVRLRYGVTSAARVGRGAGEVFEWRLSEQEDPHGNAFRVRYASHDDAGAAYPDEIRYTLRRQADGSLRSLEGDPSRDRVIDFQVAPAEARSDRPVNYAAGFERELTRRLAAIEVRVAGELLRRYELGYEQSPDSFRSLLASVSLYGADADENFPTPPRVWRFDYRSNQESGSTGWRLASSSEFDWGPAFSLIDGRNRDGGARLADVDGDGLPDLVKAFSTIQSDGTHQLSADSGVYRNTGKGFAGSPTSSFADPWPVFDCDENDDPERCNTDAPPIPLAFAWEYPSADLVWGNGMVPTDLTGDGRADLMGAIGVLFADGTETETPVSQSFQGPWCRSTGASFSCLEVFPDEFYDDEPLFTGKQGLTWTSQTDPLGLIQPTTLAFFGGNTRFGDLDGDGRPDLVVRGGEEHRLGSNGSECTLRTDYSYVAYNEGGLQFATAPLDPTAGEPAGECSTVRSRIAEDFQPCDLGANGGAERCREEGYFNRSELRNLGLEGYPWVYAAHAEYGNRVADLNGDGLADQLGWTVVKGTDRETGLLNDGGRHYLEDDRWAPPVALSEVTAFEEPNLEASPGKSRDLGVRLADVNGDGRLDLLQAVANGAQRAWRNDGDVDEAESPSPWRSSSGWTVPAAAAFVNGEGQDRGVRAIDVDGDGMTDLVRSKGGTNEVYLNRGEVPDLLRSVETPLGASTEIEYAPSTRFDNTGEDALPDLPQVVQLVRRITTDDANGAVSTRELSYQGGRFDAEDRELRGFRRVTVTRQETGRRTRTFFHQDVARAGLVECRQILDAKGSEPAAMLSCDESPSGDGPRPVKMREVRWTYTSDPDGTAPYVSLPASELRLELDGTTAPRRSLVEMEYDGRTSPSDPFTYGNLTARTAYGEVDASKADLDPSDTRTTQLVHAPPRDDASAYLVDRVVIRRLREGASPTEGTLVRETRLFYDGDTTGDAAPTRGLVTRRVDVKDLTAATGPTTTFGYDAFGNRTRTTRPRANAGEVSGSVTTRYDATFHAFPVLRTNELGHERRTRYAAPPACDGVDGAVPQPAGAGLAHLRQGPNDLARGTRTLRCFDAFGRPVLERAPEGLAERTWSYDDTPGAVTVTRSELATASGGERTTTTRRDGLGREVERRATGPGGREVVERTLYDPAGRVASREAPHFAGESPAVTRFRYDVLGRRLAVERPGSGRTTGMAHDRGLVTVTDPNGNVTERETDVFGNLVRVVEDPAGAGHRTTYRYDVAGSLGRVEDAEGNVTRIEYDSLGRKKLLDDPDTGQTRFFYDANGNLEGRIGQGEIHGWDHDALDRPRERTKGFGDPVATWTYDTAPAGIGRLASREDEAGLYEVAAYDALGRATEERYTVAGRALAFSTAFDPLGQRKERTYPSGRTLEWRRDAAGFLTAIRTRGAADYATAIEWDARGRLVHWEAGNGVPTTLGYDRDPADADGGRTGRLKKIAVGDAGGLEELTYRYDPGDRITRIGDANDPARDRSFDYDALDRLTEAAGPFGADGAAETRHYRYDPIGNLTCRASTTASGCTGGTALVYPEPGEERPHAPVSVDGQPASYDSGGNLTALGTRTYSYDALGRLEAARSAGETLATFAYTVEGRRARAVDRTGRRDVTRHLVTPDFEWDETRGLARIHVRLGGRTVATQVEPFDPGSESAGAGALPGLPGGGGGGGPWAIALGLLPAGAGAGLLLLQLARLRREGSGTARPALAGSAAIVLYVGLAPAAYAAPSDGDLNGDGRLDAADARIALQIVGGERAPTPEELEHGDVAPLEEAPESPPDLNPADVALMLRALRGADVDGDGLRARAELREGASPFRADTDRDGLSDPDELAAGSRPDDGDTDGDGVPDAQEVADGTDPSLADTDGDGTDDAADAQPLTGVRYLHADHLGSSVVVTKADGSVLERATYQPYGSVVGDTPAPEFGFTGQRFERSLGLYDYGARWYDPRLGRFLQPDSLVPEPGSPQTLNRYSYVRNNPLSRVDPTGNVSVEEIFGGVAGVLDDTLGEFGRGLGQTLGFTLGFSEAPSGGGLFFDQGVGLGSLVAGGVAVGANAVSLPVQVGASLLGVGPVTPVDGRPAGTTAVADFAQNVFTRVDRLTKTNPSVLGVLTRDVAQANTGLSHNPIGWAQGIGNVLEGARTGDLGQVGTGGLQFAKALVPRFGRFAGPGYGRFDLPAFSTPNDSSSRAHDGDVGDASTSFTQANRRLADSLRRSFSEEHALGPAEQTYRAAEFLVFEALATGGETIDE